MRWNDIGSFEANGARMKDGSLVQTELIVMGTGHHALEHTVAGFFWRRGGCAHWACSKCLAWRIQAQQLGLLESGSPH
jgi:hypothetical protein